MSNFRVSVRAPSNIAFIKYMGKKDSSLNIPENPSLSLTLHSLCSIAEIQFSDRESQVLSLRWEEERPIQLPSSNSDLNFAKDRLLVPSLGDAEKKRIDRHFERTRQAVLEIFPHFGLEVAKERCQRGEFILRTANTFPKASGIASSASSFAAMTLAFAAALARSPDEFEKAWSQDSRFRAVFARVTRQGSGSSCRSFDGPWMLWDAEDVRVLPSEAMPPMAHFVVLLQAEPKKVSSSEAHHRVRTSPLWVGRVERVQERLKTWMAALQTGDFAALARISWGEAWEMHSLFHTSSDPFTYWEPGTLEVLKWLNPLVYQAEQGSLPLVTLDAGPNIHIAVEKERREEWRYRLKERFPHLTLLEDEQGSGATLIGYSKKAVH